MEEQNLSKEKPANTFRKAFAKLIALNLLVVFGATFAILAFFFLFLPRFLFLAPLLIVPIVLFFAIRVQTSKAFVDYQKAAVKFYTEEPHKEFYKGQAKYYKEVMGEELKKEMREKLKEELREEIKKEMSQGQQAQETGTKNL
jgi:hypothetical protein